MDDWSGDGGGDTGGNSAGNSFSSGSSARYLMKSTSVVTGHEFTGHDAPRVLSVDEGEDVRAETPDASEGEGSVTKADFRNLEKRIEDVCTDNYFDCLKDVTALIDPMTKQLDELMVKSTVAPPEPFPYLTRLDLETALRHERVIITGMVLSEVRDNNIQLQRNLSTLFEQMKELAGKAPKVVRVALDHFPTLNPAPAAYNTTIPPTAPESTATAEDVPKASPEVLTTQPESICKEVSGRKSDAGVSGLVVASVSKEKKKIGPKKSSLLRIREKYSAGRIQKRQDGDEKESDEGLQFICVFKKRISQGEHEDCDFICDTVQQLSHHRQIVKHSFEQRSDGKRVPSVDTSRGPHPHACSGVTLAGEPCTYTGLISNVKRNLSTTVHTHDIAFKGSSCKLCGVKVKDFYGLLAHLRGTCGRKKLARQPADKGKKFFASDTHENDDQQQDVKPAKKRTKLESCSVMSPSSSKGSSTNDLIVALDSIDEGKSIEINIIF